jgi:hypothetical protein
VAVENPHATTPCNPYTFTLTSSGVSPKELTVPLGARVLFMNNDSRRHDMESDPHPEHDLCVELNSVGLLNPGQNRETENLVVAKTCGFHDHESASESSSRQHLAGQSPYPLTDSTYMLMAEL